MDHEIIGLDKDKLNPRGFGGMCSRETVTLRAEKGKEINFDIGIETVATTEAPALVVDWERWQVVREVLPMRYCDLTGDDTDPLLNAHSRISIEDVKGSAREWSISGPELLCKAFVSESETAIRQKIKEGHIRRVSLGYATDAAQTVEVPKNAEVTIDGVAYKNEYEDNYPFLVRTWWKKHELSLVPLGADEAAKFRVAMEKGIKTNDPELQKKIDQIIKDQEEIKNQIKTSIQIKGENHVDNPTEKTPEQLKAEAVEKILDFGKKRFNGKHNGLAVEKAAEVMRGKSYSFEEFLNDVTLLNEKEGGAVETPASFMGLTPKDLKDYSPVRAAQQLAAGKRSGLEFEISQDIEKRTGESCDTKEILMPADYQNVGLRNMYPKFGKRAHTMGTDSEGGYFVTADFRADLLKDVVVNETILGRLGATVYTGLQGQFQMPKIVSGLTNYNVAENTAATKTYMTIGLETVDQKRVSGYTEFGRQLFMNINSNLPAYDQMLIEQLYKSRNVKLDYDGINGSGAGDNPRGILNQSGPAAGSLTTVNWKNLVNMKRLIGKANGKKEDLKWATSVDVESVFDVTQKVAGQSDMLRSTDGTVLGYAAESSNQLPDATAILGYWPEYFILMFGAEKLVVADQPSHSKDMIEISLHTYMNFFLRSSESFAVADDVTVNIWQ